MEDSKLIPEDSNSIESSSEIDKKSTTEENAFTEFLEKTSNKEIKVGKSNSDPKIKKQEIKSNSLFKRILNDGFDGISSNPNYKLLTLLIILLVNLSLFFVIGNVGKAFLKNAGIM